MSRGTVVGLASLLLLLVALGPSSATRASAKAPTFKDVPCETLMTIPDGFDASRLRCGSITVRENRAESGRTIEIAAAVLKATGPEVKRDPIVFLTGGPGQHAASSIVGIAEWYGASLGDRDFITFDPRGTGASGALACAEYDQVAPDTLIENLSDEEAMARQDEAAAICRKRYVDAGVDLRQYNSAAIVQDMVDLMQSLGYEEWNLIGGSYGTRLALTALRDAHQFIRSAVLDAPVAPVLNVDIARVSLLEGKFKKLWAACAADAKCGAAYPHIEETFWDLVARANASPITVEVTAPDGTHPTVTIDGSTIIRGTAQAMSDTSLLPVIPFAIDDIARGNTGVLSLLASTLVYDDAGISTGMFLSVQCNEKWPFYTDAAVRAGVAGVRPEIVNANYGDASNVAFAEHSRSFCKTWSDADIDRVENAAVASGAPTLILAGELDTNTPTEFSDVVARTLWNSYVVDVPSSGHFVTAPRSNCTDPMIAAFFSRPNVRPDDSCIRAIPPIDFVVADAAPVESPSVVAAPAAEPVSGAIKAPDTGMGQESRSGRAWVYAAMMIIEGGAFVGTGVKRRSVRQARRD